MLREEVLTKWRRCSTIIKDQQEITKLLIEEDQIPSFPVGYDTIKNNLDFWTSFEYREKIRKSKDRIIKVSNDDKHYSEDFVILQLIFNMRNDMFLELTEAMKKKNTP